MSAYIRFLSHSKLTTPTHFNVLVLPHAQMVMGIASAMKVKHHITSPSQHPCGPSIGNPDNVAE